jgi:hypothetical protein
MPLSLLPAFFFAEISALAAPPTKSELPRITDITTDTNELYLCD